MQDGAEPFDIHAYLASRLTPSWGPFPLEGFAVWSNVLAGTVSLQARINGQLTTIVLHPDHAMYMASLLRDAAVMQWRAWNLATESKQ